MTMQGLVKAYTVKGLDEDGLRGDAGRVRGIQVVKLEPVTGGHLVEFWISPPFGPEHAAEAETILTARSSSFTAKGDAA